MKLKEFSIEGVSSRFLRRTIWLIYIPVAVIATVFCGMIEGLVSMFESIRDLLSDLFEVALKVWRQ